MQGDDFGGVNRDRVEEPTLALVELPVRSGVRPAIPDSYRLTDDAVEYFEEHRSREGEWKPICSRLEVLAHTRDVRGDNWGKLVRFSDADGREKTISLPMTLFAGQGGELREMLLRLGLCIEPDRKAKERLEGYIQKCNPEGKLVCVSKTGWTTSPQGRSFALPDRVFGGQGIVFQADEVVRHAFEVKHDLKFWNDQLGHLLPGNSRLILAASAAFAPPLLGLVDMDGGGFHLVGHSSVGKTTLLRFAASIWGGGQFGYVRPWRATSNGLEGIAALHNDLLLCLDEIGEVDGREVGAIAYMLANGCGKARASRAGSARAAHQWRIIFLSTGELTLADKVREDGGSRVRAGQEVRVVDVPADAGAGLGCFESLGAFSTPAALAQHIATASSHFYGAPGRAFLEALVALNLNDVAVAAKANIEQFKATFLPPSAGGQVDRVATRFGLLAVAGELAIQFGILPALAPGAAIEGVGVCFNAWLSGRGTDGDAEDERLIRQVFAVISRDGESRFSPLGRQDGNNWDGGNVDLEGAFAPAARATHNRLGYWREESDGIHFLVFPEAMKTEVCKGFRWEWAGRKLAERGLIVRGDSNHLGRKFRIPGSQEQVRLIDVTPKIFGAASDVARG